MIPCRFDAFFMESCWSEVWPIRAKRKSRPPASGQILPSRTGRQQIDHPTRRLGASRRSPSVTPPPRRTMFSHRGAAGRRLTPQPLCQNPTTVPRGPHCSGQRGRATRLSPRGDGGTRPGASQREGASQPEARGDPVPPTRVRPSAIRARRCHGRPAPARRQVSPARLTRF